MQTYVIVGAGQAGAWLARTLREQDGQARIVLIGEETAAPYERPPLSKEVLRGDAPPDSTTIITPELAEELSIELILDEKVESIDRRTHAVICQSEGSFKYDKLFITTGSRVRNIPMDDIPADRVCYLRTLEDANRLHQAFQGHERVLIVGGGWIGLEVAAAARQMGKSVQIVEMAERLCARAVPAAISDYLLDLHRQNGVEIQLGTSASLQWNGNAVQATLSEGGKQIMADIVVVAAGIVPNVELAADAGLEVDNGIVVDEYGQTSDPNIYAAGDVTNHPCVHAGTRARIESWDNAQNQAIAVAKAALGEANPYSNVPWFWSDQFDVNLQIVGLPPANIEPISRGKPAEGKGLWLFWQKDKVASAIAVNEPRDIRVVKKWMEKGQYPTPDSVSDEGVKLKKIPIS